MRGAEVLGNAFRFPCFVKFLFPEADAEGLNWLQPQLAVHRLQRMLQTLADVLLKEPFRLARLVEALGEAFRLMDPSS